MLLGNRNNSQHDSSWLTHLPADSDYRKALKSIEEKILIRGDLPYAKY